MPDQVGDSVVGDHPVVRDAGDSAKGVIGAVARGVHLADDRVFGAGHHGGVRQRGHGSADTVAAVMEP